MTDRYEAKMDNNYFISSEQYWEVMIKANSLNGLNNVCSAINLLRKGINVADQGVKLDFLESENKHMKSVLDENKHLKGTIDNLSDDYQKLLKENQELKSKQLKKNPNKPGSLAQQMRCDKSMTKWKEEVHNRDKVCQCCGDPVDLQCHHIMPLSKYPLLGNDVDNGILLCGSCHDDYHKAYEGSEGAASLAKFMKEFGQFQ